MTEQNYGSKGLAGLGGTEDSEAEEAIGQNGV